MATKRSRTNNKTVDALITLAFQMSQEEARISEAEPATSRVSEIKLSPSYQTASDSLGPDLIQRILRGEIKPPVEERMDLD